MCVSTNKITCPNCGEEILREDWDREESQECECCGIIYDIEIIYEDDEEVIFQTYQ